MYSMGISKFQELAKESGAVYKVKQMCLVNTEIFDKYLESFRVDPECGFYKQEGAVVTDGVVVVAFTIKVAPDEVEAVNNAIAYGGIQLYLTKN